MCVFCKRGESECKRERERIVRRDERREGADGKREIERNRVKIKGKWK